MEQDFFVTEIKKLAKTKYEVSLEGGEPLILYGKELSAYSIREQSVLPGPVYEQIIREVLSKRATRRAMHLLEKMDRTEADLREKLRKNGYPQSCIDAAIEYVTGYHYLDDQRYAQNYILFYQSKYSRRILMQKLLQKGVDRQTIEECMDEIYTSDERAMIVKLLKKRGYDPAHADIKEKQKTYAFLMRKGFSSSEISAAMKQEW